MKQLHFPTLLLSDMVPGLIDLQLDAKAPSMVLKYKSGWLRWREWALLRIGVPVIAMFLVMSPIVVNVPTRGLLAVETMHAIVQWLENLNIKRNMTSMFVNKKHCYSSKTFAYRIVYL